MFNISNAQEQCFITTLDGREKVEFQFVPREMEYSRSNKLVGIPVVGRSNDQYQYTGGTETLNFSLTFFSDDEGRENAMKQVRALSALGMNDGGFGPARRVKLIMGNLFPREIWSLKVVNSKVGNFDNRNNYYPIYATIDIQLVLNPRRNRRRSDVKRI